MIYYSQYQQDKFLNQNFFFNKKGGVFVDIGAHDGISGSNSAFFEKSLNWTGICIEPIKSVYEKLIKNRSCKCICAAAWKENATKKFKVIDGYSEMLSGLTDCYDSNHINRINSEVQSFSQKSSDIDVSCIDINEILQKESLFNIDYLSIDTEGSEEEIIKHIDFSKFNIEFISAENNYNSNSLREYLLSVGYKFINRLEIDDIYQKIK